METLQLSLRAARFAQPRLVTANNHFMTMYRSVLASTLVSLVTGSIVAQDVDLSNIATGTGGFVMNGQAPFDQSGRSVSAAGDVNGDGLGDLIIGAPFSDPAAGSNAGRSYVVFGKSNTVAVNLSEVDNGIGGFVINGQALSDRSGISVSAAGDVNGDGLADVIVGAPFSNPAAGLTAGRSYVVFGKTNTADVDLSDIDNGLGGFVINGQTSSDLSGFSVSAAGDVNGDGLADLIVGAPNSTPAAGTRAGRSYVVFGKTNTAAVDLSAVDNGIGGFVINGQAAIDYSGTSVSCAGDVNGDGLSDLIVGARLSDPPSATNAGRSYVVFGKKTTADVDLSAINNGIGGFVINGQGAFDESGTSVSAAGDVNGDGLADLLVGAPYSDPASGVSAGRSYVVFGKTNTATVELSAIDNGTGGFVINGQAGSDESGRSVSAAGDVNGDGLADVIVGAFRSDPGALFDAGRSYVVFGKTNTAAVDLSAVDNGTGGFVINGQAAFDLSGSSVAAAGDVNGDGLADVIVGAPSGDPPSGTDAGRSYVVFSPVAPATSGTYLGRVAAGDAPRQGIGVHRFGHDAVIFPDSRAWVDFNGGSGPGLDNSSLVTVTLTRNNSGLTVAVPLSSVADVRWDITTNRTGWSNCRVTFQYTNAEIAGLVEPNLRIYRAPSPAGPWTQLPNQTIDLARNHISGDTSTFSSFILFETNLLAVDLVSFTAAAESPAAPVVITWSTAAEFDTAGFHVESAPSHLGPWSRVSSTLIPAEGSAAAGATYTLVDPTPIASGERWYRLAETVLDGTTVTYEPARATVGSAASSVGAWMLY